MSLIVRGLFLAAAAAGLLGVLAAPAGAQEFNWQQLPDMPERQPAFAAAAHGGLVYLIGASQTPTNRVQIFDPATGEWRDGPPLPTGRERAEGMAVTLGDRIYFLGGGGNGVVTPRFAPMRDYLDLSGDEAAWVEDGSFSAVKSAAAVADGDTAIIVGGRTGAGQSALAQRFDPAGGGASLPDLAVARDHLGVARVGDLLVAVGGFENAPGTPFGNPLATVERLNPGVDDAWSAGEALPAARAMSGVVAFNGRVYVIGGFEVDPNGGFLGAATARVDSYDPVLDSWQRLPDLPAAASQLRAVVVDELIYVFSAEFGAVFRGGFGDLGPIPGQDATPTPSPTPRVSPTPTPTLLPTPAVTDGAVEPTPPVSVTPGPTPTLGPTPGVSPTPPAPSATPEATPPVSPSPTPADNGGGNGNGNGTPPVPTDDPWAGVDLGGDDGGCSCRSNAGADLLWALPLLGLLWWRRRRGAAALLLLLLVPGAAQAQPAAEAEAPKVLRPAPPEGLRWEMGPPPPHRQIAAAVAELNGEIYVMGSGGRHQERVQIFNIERQEWREGTPLRTPRFGAIGASHGKSVYLFSGGNKPSLKEPFFHAWEQLTVAGDWVAGGKWSPRKNGASARLGSRLFMFGGRGTSTEASTETDFFDFDTRKGEVLPKLVHPREFLAGAAVRNTLFAIGGFLPEPDTPYGKPTGSVEAMPLNDWFWRERAPLKVPRAMHGAVAARGRIIVAGGVISVPLGDGGLNQARPTKSVEIYDPEKDAWVEGPALPGPSEELTLLHVGDTIFGIDARYKQLFIGHLPVIEVAPPAPPPRPGLDIRWVMAAAALVFALVVAGIVAKKRAA